MRLKKENKKCNYEHKKKKERSEIEIIAQCQIELYMYDIPSYLFVYRLFDYLYSKENQITTWQLLELVGWLLVGVAMGVVVCPIC